MGRSRGLEPPTFGTTNRRSNQLSYDRHGPGALPKRRCCERQEGPSSNDWDGGGLLHKRQKMQSESCLPLILTQ